MKDKQKHPITAAEAGRRAWKGTSKAERAAIMRARACHRWRFPCGQRRGLAHNPKLCKRPDCPGRG
jgi:hypothetical protein